MIPDTLKRNGLFLLAYLMAIFVVGCSAKQVILEDVNKYNLSTQTFKYKNIPIYFGVDTQNIKDTFSIYIEGDGRGWISKRKPSDDPTPSNSLVLKLMEKDIRPKVYLARPCMYVQTEFCEQYYWTEGRHHPKLVEAMSKAIDHLKTLYGVSNFELIGHSGGGSMAVLIAEKRSDIKRIITIAGNLDIEAFVKHHRVTAMKGSLNPLYVAEKIQYIPQLHFIGGQDKIVPEKLVANFVKKSASICVQSKVYKDFGHFEDWVSVWSDILNEKPPC